MQDLLRTLQDHDLGQLRIIAELWGLDGPSGTTVEAARRLARAMLDPAAAREIAEGLRPADREALDYLLAQEGRLPLPDMTRRFGPLRKMGAGRRDREKPWRTPASPVEALWYRGLIARGFAETPTGPQEFAFIPSDLMPLLPVPEAPAEQPFGHLAATPPSIARPASSAAAVDDATTLLAALRRRDAKALPLGARRTAGLAPFLFQPASVNQLLVILQEQGLLAGPPYRPTPETVRAFLDTPPAEAARQLLDAWRSSHAWNDLQQIPYLEAPSSGWPNDPPVARRAILHFLKDIPPRQWWDLESFVAAVRERQPGFQRPAGDFDSWYLRDLRHGSFLRGFEHWETIEGALLRSMISYPLHWLGVADLGGPTPESPPDAFRLTSFAPLLSAPQEAIGLGTDASARVSLEFDGRLHVPLAASRAQRYQIARITTWERLDDAGHHYRLTPSSLQLAARQNLQVTHVRTILETATGRPLPAALARAIERWAASGAEAHLDRTLVLRVSSRRVLEELRRNRATARYLGEPLGPTAILISQRDWERLCAATARLGLLIDSPTGSVEEAP
jgi:hypothetical protein